MSSNTTPQRRSVITSDQPNGSPSFSVRVVEKPSSASKFSAFNLVLRESYLTSEYCLISNQPKLGGIYVIPSSKSTNLWFGVIFVHHGPYISGVFRFTIVFHDNFPDNQSLPVVTFHPAIFNPSISQKGNFDLKRHFKHGWSKQFNHVWQILKCIKAAFYKIEASTPINKIAQELYEDNFDMFEKKAQKEVEASNQRLYEEPPEHLIDAHYIKFSPYNPTLHDAVRAKALQPLLTFQNSFTNSTSVISSLNNFHTTAASSGESGDLTNSTNSIATTTTSSSSAAATRLSLSPPTPACIKRGLSWLKEKFSTNNSINKTI